MTAACSMRWGSRRTRRSRALSISAGPSSQRRTDHGRRLMILCRATARAEIAAGELALQEFARTMFYDTRKNDHGLPYNPFKAIVTPRPIGWITSMSSKGEVNLAPYSFFNAVSEHPHMVAFSSSGRKDAVTFIEETGEFVCNLATYDLRDQM